MIGVLRQLRHGPLKSFNGVWVTLGKIYQQIIQILPDNLIKVEQKIGNYGPFVLDAKFAFSNFKNWGGAHNKAFDWCIEYAKNKNTILDLGAHIGLVALPLSRVINKEGKVYCFEPAFSNLKHLYSHINKNNIKNIEVVESLVGATNKTNIDFYEANQASGMNSAVTRIKDSSKYKIAKKNQVCLSDFCKKMQIIPDLIKIDVEGFEYEVLKGAKELLSNTSPVICLSVHPRELAALGVSNEELFNLINDLGYRLVDLNFNLVTSLKLDEYLMVKAEKIAEIQKEMS